MGYGEKQSLAAWLAGPLMAGNLGMTNFFGRRGELALYRKGRRAAQTPPCAT